MTIESLKELGYKVYVTHFRYANANRRQLKPTNEFRANGMSGLIHPKGGLTTIELKKGDVVAAKAEAKCSQEESFNKKIGLNICIGRVARQLAATKQI